MKALRASTILKKARDLISNKKNWTKGAWTRDKKGVALLGWNDPDAVKFCSLGAIARVAGRSIWEGNEYKYLDRALEKQIGPMVSVMTYNDARHRKHKEILSLFDEAIKLARKDERREFRYGSSK